MNPLSPPTTTELPGSSASMTASASSAGRVADRLHSITLTPAPSTWADLIATWRRAPANTFADTRAFRSELSLPTDRPVVLTGHQAEFWHPGIVAKYLAAHAVAAKNNAAVGWVVVDQDSNTPATIRYPRREKHKSLAVRTWEALPDVDSLVELNAPLAAIPARAPSPVPKDDTDPHVATGLSNIHRALAAHTGASSVAQQVARAAADLIGGVIPAAPLIFATDLARTGLFAAILDRMRQDPAGCATLYNKAVAANPAAGMAPLRIGGDPELPLWVMSSKSGQPRTRATARTLASISTKAGCSLAPRALLMTAMLRMAAGDLFIHGFGGGIYDTITEQWIREWLGVELAPTVVASATLHLPIDADVMPPAAIDHAQWQAHHVRHDPAMLGDAAAASKKVEILARINELKRTGQSPAAAFAELQQLLQSLRAAHAATISAFDHTASEARTHRADATIAHDRTWAFPLYPEADIRRLKTEIEARFA